jgi:hypothetical protein
MTAPPTDLFVSSPVLESKTTLAADPLITILGGAIVGLILGIFQWLILRGKIKKSGYWLVAEILGLAIAWLTTSSAKMDLDFVYGVVIGALLGLFQWLMLGSWGRLALLWLPVSVGAWALGFVTHKIWYSFKWDFFPGLASVIWISMPGIVAGLVTALLLVWLLRSRSARARDIELAARESLQDESATVL